MLNHSHDHDHHHHEHPQDGPVSLGRRGFLKFAGFSLAGTALAGCRRPVEKAIPLLVQPEEITPGQALWYASTCGGCAAGCGVLVKNRDGRPIKLEGNPAHPLSKGGLCAIGQASVVELYDSHRLANPLEAGQASTWAAVDRKILERLETIRQQGGAVRLLTGTVNSPTTRAVIDRFLAGFADGRHVAYDALSASAILDAHDRTHGQRLLPRYRFDRADVIVSLDADFLGTWISPVEFTTGYRARRNIEKNNGRRAYHVQFESRLSLTGASADRRICIAPDEYATLAAELGAALGDQPANGIRPDIRELADRLKNARGRSLVVCGVNDLEVQVRVNLINHLLGNYGHTVDLERPSFQAAGDDRSHEDLIDELTAGKVSALIVSGVNPVYELPGGGKLAEAIRRVPLAVSTAEHPDETSRLAHFVCPEPHFLECWHDHEPVAGVASVAQPVIQRLGRTRPLAESLSAWMGQPKTDYELITSHWREKVHPLLAEPKAFQAFWDQTVHDGYALLDGPAAPVASFQATAVPAPPTPAEEGSEKPHWVVLYPKVSLREGRHAFNPWLQELPDPISRVSWDNYASLSPAAARNMNVVEGDVISMTVAGVDHTEPVIELPVHLQPGQHDRVIAIALGYGRAGTERFAEIGPQWIESKPSVGANGRVGANAAPLIGWNGNHLVYAGRVSRLTRLGRRHTLATIQSYHTLDLPEGTAPHGQETRDIIRHTTLQEYRQAAAPRQIDAANAAATSRPAPAVPPSMWPDHRYDGHRWAMAIDLDACTGCGGCVVACQIENNVPVVGKDEMSRSREMHWLRIERYYSHNSKRNSKRCQDEFSGTPTGADGLLTTGENQPDTFSVAFQPMLCHHCENAPCETVCPVLATMHSKEGLNQQVYNRCVGTRYCANNCPYKMRRFNWFDYAHDDAMENLILNPDVTVRSRGVMEKCSFCVQRIQAAKIEAKGRGATLKDGDAQPACQQSCPARAIVFGDMNDPDSEISRLQRSPRYYRLLEELNVRPAVGYLMAVRDADTAPGGAHHG